MVSTLSFAKLTPLAGLWRRFGAFVHELLFLVAYLFIMGLAFAVVSGESMSAGKPQILSGPIAILQQLYLFVTIGAYFIFFWIKGRRTLAFKTWQLRLVSQEALARETNAFALNHADDAARAPTTSTPRQPIDATTKNSTHPFAFAAISTRQAVIRYLATWIGPALGLFVYTTLSTSTGPLWIFVLFTNFFWALIDPAKQFLHDRIAGTRVLYVRE